MGEAMERHYGGHLCYGPPIEEGYYYDMFCDGRLSCFFIYSITFSLQLLFLCLSKCFSLGMEKITGKKRWQVHRVRRSALYLFLKLLDFNPQDTVLCKY